jgi:hypothetical protein
VQQQQGIHTDIPPQAAKGFKQVVVVLITSPTVVTVITAPTHTTPPIITIAAQ